MKYFVDFEATQFSEEVISIGCVREDGETFYSLVAPVEGKITPFITNLTGITAEMLQDAMSPDRVFESFYDWVFRNEEIPDFFVWGNGDVNFLRHTFKRTQSQKARMAIGYIAGSISDYAKTFYEIIKTNNCSLIKAYNGLINDKKTQNHNALDDAVLLFEVYKTVAEMDNETIREKMSAVMPVKKAKVKKVTQLQPVYVAWDEMGFPSGTICVINKHQEAIMHWASLEEAAQWVFDNKVAKTQKAAVTLERIQKKIKGAYSCGANYYAFNWRKIA